MASRNGSSSNKVLILLAPGFEEGAVVYCLDRMREAGLPVSLVSLTAGLVNGLHGLVVRPDYSLDQLVPGVPQRLVIVPGGRQCTTSLLADPRVHQLFEVTLAHKGFVAAMVTAEPLLAQVRLPPPSDVSHFVPQGDMAINDFTSRLINLVSG